jgi:hypothetical protein
MPTLTRRRYPERRLRAGAEGEAEMMSDAEIVDVKELQERLVSVEGKVLALTFLLRKLINMDVLPANAVVRLTKEMQDLATPTEFSEAIVQTALDMLAVLITKADPEVPTFSVIQGGKTDNSDPAAG